MAVAVDSREGVSAARSSRGAAGGSVLRFKEARAWSDAPTSRGAGWFWPRRRTSELGGWWEATLTRGPVLSAATGRRARQRLPGRAGPAQEEAGEGKGKPSGPAEGGSWASGGNWASRETASRPEMRQ